MLPMVQSIFKKRSSQKRIYLNGSRQIPDFLLVFLVIGTCCSQLLESFGNIGRKHNLDAEGSVWI